MYPVEFRVLGPLELKIHQNLVSLGGMKPRVVISSLLASEKWHASISYLVDAVWGDNPPSTAGKQIRNAISSLRAVLTPNGVTITSVADGYRLDIGDARLDLLRFHDHLSRAHRYLGEGQQVDAVDEFRSALSEWSGPMLSGIESDLLHVQVASMNEKRLSAIEEYVDLEIALGRHKNILSELAGWSAENPLRERLVAQHVLALHRSGARAQAFTVYERNCQQLVEQLGLGPGPELSAVHKLMLQEDATESVPSERVGVVPGTLGREQDSWSESVTVSVPDSLPADISHFVGRATEIRTLLADTYHSEPKRVLAIDGMPGAGKTALALHVAHQSASQYPDGQHFLDLYGHDPIYDPLSRSAALRQLLLRTGVPTCSLPYDSEELAALWRARSSEMRLLIVLDNAASAEQVRPLLPAGEGCLTLVTSRRRLTMTSWSASRLISLDSPLPRSDGYDLFCRLLGRQRSNPDWVTVDRILELCGDLPLAISAAASRLRRRPSWPLAHLAEQLSNDRLLLAVLQTEQGGITTCFDASFRHLSSDQQNLLQVLGTAEGPNIDVATATTLAGLPSYVAERMLEELVDEHLLLQPYPNCYEMHPLVKVYCAEMREHDRTSDPRVWWTARPHILWPHHQNILA